jgi:hypothetical protein
LVEGQRFWDWIVEKVKYENSTRDWTRAIEMPKASYFRPSELDQVIKLVESNITGVLTPLVEEREDELVDSEEFIDNVDRHERDMYYEFQDEISENTNNDGIVKSLRGILRKYNGHGDGSGTTSVL